MKIAFTGKGGVGKTTMASILIHDLAKSGRRVLAVDCDPDANLAAALGFSDPASITPISKMKEMIYDRMEIKDKDPSFYKLNPHIEDIPEKFTKKMGNINLLVMGTVEKSGGGCVCPESIFLKNLLNRIMLNEGDDIVLDMEAGIEHLGRRTAEISDYFVVVVEPSERSIDTALKIADLAKGQGVKKVFAIANKIKTKEDTDFIKKGLAGIEVAAEVPFTDDILAIDKGGSIKDLKDPGIKSLMNKLRTLIPEKIG